MFADYITLNVEYCKGYTHRKNCLELINKFSKVVVNTRKSITCLYTNNEQFDKEIKKIIYKSITKNKMLKS